MQSVSDAFSRVQDLIAPAAAFGRKEADGWVLVGWDPPDRPAGEPIRDEHFRNLWVRHETYRPLSDFELSSLSARLRKLSRPDVIPDDLAEFFTRCSNGLSIAAGDLSIFGLGRGSRHDPYDLVEATLVPPPGAPAKALFFGAWGDERNRIYADAETGAVHVAGLESAAPLLSWPGFAQFLVDACETHTRSFDETGRRIGVASLPEEAGSTIERARPWEAMDPTPFDTEALETVRAALARFDGRTTRMKRVTYEMVEPAELEFAQAGYSYTTAGESLLAEGWRREWIVVGFDEDLGDPLVVDASRAELPVLTGPHGEGDWSLLPIAASLGDLKPRPR